MPIAVISCINCASPLRTRTTYRFSNRPVAPRAVRRIIARTSVWNCRMCRWGNAADRLEFRGSGWWREENILRVAPGLGPICPSTSLRLAKRLLLKYWNVKHSFIEVNIAFRPFQIKRPRVLSESLVRLPGILCKDQGGFFRRAGQTGRSFPCAVNHTGGALTNAERRCAGGALDSGPARSYITPTARDCRARSSAVERSFHMREVAGSNPAAPTIFHLLGVTFDHGRVSSVC